MTVAVWGLTFKARTDDLRDSPSLEIIRRLRERGARIQAYDPAVEPGDTDAEARRHRGRWPTPTPPATTPQVLAVLTEWDEFKWLDFDKVAETMAHRRVVDARNLLDRNGAHAGAASSSRASGGPEPVGRIVVTGGAGFLGSHLCESLLDRGDEVVCLDNLVTGGIANIEHLFGRPGFTFSEYDVSEFVWVPGAVDGVLHFASPASPKDYLDMPIQTLKVGSLGTHNTLGLAKAKGARFFLASTSEVYGDPQVHPQPETYWGHVNPVGPRGVYDEAKRFAEAMTMAYHRYHGLDVRIVRIFNTYGPADAAATTGGWCRTSSSRRSQGKPITIYGDGTQTRSFCYVDDEVRGLARPVRLRPDRAGQHRQPERVHDRASWPRSCIEVTGSSSEIVHEPLPVDDPTQRQPDITLARTRLGWEPQVQLREGIERTAAYFQQILES